MELEISSALQKALTETAIKAFLDKLMKSVGRFIFGDIEGMSKQYSIIGRHFLQSNAVEYEYEPLTEKYRLWKLKKVGKKPILVLTGAWNKAALQSTVRKRSGRRWEVTPQKPPKYAKYLEKGSDKMPARPAFTVNDRDEQEVMKFAQKVVDDEYGKLARIAGQDMKKVV